MEYSSILVCKVIRYGLMAKPGGVFITNKNTGGGGICPPLVVRADAPDHRECRSGILMKENG